MSNLVIITDLREGDQSVFELATILRLVRMSGRFCLFDGKTSSAADPKYV